MYNIKKFLTEDEEILWNYKEVKSLIIGPIIHVVIGAFLMIFLIIAILITASYLDPILFYIALTLIFIPIFIFIRSINSAIKEYKEKVRIFELNFKQLRNYECQYILTNKRWIQKDLELNSMIDISKYDKSVIRKEKDIVFVDLGAIQVIYTFQNKDNIIAFYFEYKEQNHLETNLGVWLPLNEFTNVINILKELIPIEREEIDELGAKISYRKIEN